MTLGEFRKALAHFPDTSDIVGENFGDIEIGNISSLDTYPAHYTVSIRLRDPKKRVVKLETLSLWLKTGMRVTGTYSDGTPFEAVVVSTNNDREEAK